MSAGFVFYVASAATLIYGFVLYATVTLKFRWIVARFEQTPELMASGLFPLPIAGVKTFGYVLCLLLLDAMPDWAVDRAIRKGNVRPGVSRTALLEHFSKDDRREARRVKWALMPWCAIVFVLVLCHAIGSPMSTQP